MTKTTATARIGSMVVIALAGCAPAIQADTDTDVAACVASPELVVEQVDTLGARIASPVDLGARILLPCPGPSAIEAVVQGPRSFELGPAPAEATGPTEVELTLMYTPADYGPHEVLLRARVGGLDLELALRGVPDPDQDGDGVEAVPVGGLDCDDFDAAVFPGAVDDDASSDLDCDGILDEVVEADQVRITEVMNAPSAGTLTTGMWVEVENRSDRAIDLTGWSLEADGDTMRVVDAEPIAPGTLGVLAMDPVRLRRAGIVASGRLAGTPVSAQRVVLRVGERIISEAAAGPAPAGATRGLEPEAPDPADPRAWCTQSRAMANGDRGTPGRTNERCASFDDDADGDGFTERQGDCDDADPAVHPDAAERWNGMDDDCDRSTDHVAWIDLDTGEVTARPGDSFGAFVELGDLDGDGTTEVYLGHETAPSVIIAGPDLLAPSAPADPILDVPYLGRFDALYPPIAQAGDLTGDGAINLAFTGQSEDRGLRVWPAGATALTDAAATLTVRDNVGRDGWVGDVDGDGINEVWVRSVGRESRPALLSLADTEGTVDVEDVVVSRGPTWHTPVLSGVDPNEDGYDDSLFSYDGSFYLVHGSSSPEDVEATDADLQLDLGYGSTLAAVVDMDQTGAPEIVVHASGFEGDATGSLLHTDAVWTVDMPPSATILAGGDLDGDGDDELALSDVYSRPSSVWFLEGPFASGTSPIARHLGAQLSLPALVGPSDLADLDGDGDKDLVLWDWRARGASANFVGAINEAL